MDTPYLFPNLKERVQILFQVIKHMKYGNKYLMKKMVKVRLPREPYEGQIYYDPDNELIFLYEKGRWIDVTDLDIAKTEF